MYRFDMIEYCESHELIQIQIDESANDGQVLGAAMSNFCCVCAGTIGMQPEIDPSAHRVWVRFGDVASTAVGPRPTSWLTQSLDVRLDRPGTTRPRRSIYAGGGITAWGPCTQELAAKGYMKQSFQDYLIGQFLERWRDELEIQGLNLLPVLPNTRVWIGGDPSTQWSYTERGKIIEITHATLPEPEEHYINYFHLIPPPQPDPEEEAREKAELAELMAMPLEERAEYLSQIAREAKRKKRIARGEEPE